VKFRVTHKTKYVYGETVPLGHNIIRLRPRTTHWQTCLSNEIRFDPEPAHQRDRVDFFGNHETWISVQEPHRQLAIVAESQIETISPPAEAEPDGPAWDIVPQTLRSSREPTLVAACEYTFASPLVPVCPGLADYARPSFPDGAPLVPCAVDLTMRIYKEFKFDKDATTIGTPTLEVLKQKRGVCQDFAQLQIGCFRSLGLAARYVSGYVMTRPPPGQKRLVGADASHAWVSVFVPDIGWIDLDPTNGLIPKGEHITLAWARDYNDIIPIKGVITGGQRHSLFYSVDVEPMESPAQPAPPAPPGAG
jgi:transglutaminase-like putative cysteine protease